VAHFAIVGKVAGAWCMKRLRADRHQRGRADRRHAGGWLRARPNDVDHVHPRSFESIVAELLKDRGWTVELTKTTHDGGYDVLALRSDALGFVNTVLVECKLYDLHRPVGIAMVDRLMGVRSRENATAGLLVTNSRYSLDAWRAWESRIGRDLKLVDRGELFEWLEHYKELPDAAAT